MIRATREGTVEDVNDALFTLRANPDIPDEVSNITSFMDIMCQALHMFIHLNLYIRICSVCV